MIAQNDVNKPDIIVRVTAIVEGKCLHTILSNKLFKIIGISDLLNPESTLAMALRYIPPLAFVP